MVINAPAAGTCVASLWGPRRARVPRSFESDDLFADSDPGGMFSLVGPIAMPLRSRVKVSKL